MQYADTITEINLCNKNENSLLQTKLNLAQMTIKSLGKKIF